MFTPDDTMAHRQLRESSSSSSTYMALLNTLATDLDYMLTDLCTTPPPPYENGATVGHEGDITHIRGDAFLEPYMQGLAPPDFSSSPHTSVPTVNASSAEQTPHTATPEDGESITSSPVGDNHNTLADLSAQLRFLELDASADSLDQGHDSSLSSSAASSEVGGSGEGGNAPCNISLLERLIRSHPVWFLPGIQRAGAFHLLQGKEEGNFVVRQSSQPDTMAISVRLPAGKGPYIEHYLIQAVDGELSLESSDNRFSNIPSLIAHYSQCCDELPVQLTLPRAMREAKNHQQLSSLALLGQEFWRYPMANPRPPEQQNQQHSETSSSQQRVAVGESLQSPPSSGSSLSSLGSGNNNHNSGHDIAARTPSSELGGGSGIGDAIVLNLAPLSSTEHSQQPQSLMSTFKGSGASSSCDVIGSPSSPTSSSVVPGVGSAIVVTTASTSSSIAATALVRGPRPTPPNTLNLMCSASSHTSSLAASGMRSASNSPAQLVSPPSTNSTNGDGSRAGPLVLSGGGGGGKTPPPPPPRWAKPTTLTSAALPGQNFTVTTTVTFSVNHNTTPPPHVEVSCVQVTPKRPQMESDGLQTMSSHCSSASTLEQCGVRLHQVMSPTTPSDISKLPGNGRGKKHRPSHGRQTTIKESHHYQESDILESPTVYYRSSVADKVSDYEDIWGPEMLSTFKPPHPFPRSSPFSSPEDISTSSGGNKKTPDLLERITTPVSGSCISLNSANGNLKDQQQRNRLGLVINTGSCTNSVTNSPMSPLGTETKQQSEEPGSMTPKNTKQGSPFYAEPADALRQAALVPRRRPRPGGQQIFQQQTRNHRHSDPASFQQWPVLPHHTGQLERIDSNDELTATPLSSSVDNLALLKPSRNGATSQQNINRPRGKPVQPPRIRPKNMRGKCFNDTSWAVDSSWEFIGNEDDGEDSEHGEGGLEERERRFPTLEQQENSLGVGDGMSSGGRKITVQDLIAQRFPSLRLSPEILSPNVLPGISSPLDSRMSSYDNVEGRNGGSHDIIASSNHNHHNVTLHHNHPSSNHHCASQISDNEDTQTVFSEPWDSSRWENLLHPDHTETNLSLGSNSVVQVMGQTPLLGPEEDDTMCGTNTNRIHSNHMVNGCTSNNGHISRTKSFKERLDPLLSPPRLQALRNRDLGGTGASIRAYALHLAADKSTTFAQNIDNFIACTRDSRETNPQVVMRNMRQFMSGMKNYLVKHGEREFEKEVEKERVKLKSTEFLNLDAILESVMHKLVVRPLKEHLYQLFVEEYTRTGAIQLLADNIQYARTKPMHELGVRARIAPPSEEALETICHLLTKLQEVDSPLDKLESLLACIGTIFNSVKSANQRCVALGADDFLPLFVWVLVQSGMLAAEIEADYMWGLLHPSLLSGEGGYYLTTLSSAVHVLKNFRLCSEEQSKTLGPGASLDWKVASLTEFRSVLKIVVPDEMHGSIITKTLPVRPNMTTRDVCKIIAHKVRITNPQDYGLFKLVDGEETLLADGECPQDIKGNVAQAGKHCMFAYKRIDAKIAWPRTSSPH